MTYAEPLASSEQAGGEARHDTSFVLDRNPHVATVAFYVAMAVALALYVWAGRNRWFFGDEWDFLVARDAGSAAGLLEPHGEHWTTLPILAYRLLWNVFGLRTYVPYQLMSILLHLMAAWLLRVAMRRAGVSAWVATAAAASFLFFGAGDANILRGFQITFGGALVFGLIQLLLADHDGPLDRRDAVGLLAGLAGLMCSGIAIAMVAGVGVATFVRRGWRVALVHTVPLYAVYGIWWLAYGRDDVGRRSSSVRALASFIESAVTESFDALGQVWIVGWLIGLVLIVGLVLAWRHPGRPDVRRRAALPLGLLGALAVFLATTAWSRAYFGDEAARHSRYLHIVAALSIVAIAVAADTLARRWPIITPALVVLLLIGIPGNVDIFVNHKGEGRGTRLEKELMLAAAHMPLPDGIPPSSRPDAAVAHYVTIGWLREGAASGKIPRPEEIDEGLADAVRFRLSLQQVRQSPLPGSCQPLQGGREVHLDAGESFGFQAKKVIVVAAGHRGDARGRLEFDSVEGQTLTALAGPLDLVVQPARNTPARVCGLARLGR